MTDLGEWLTAQLDTDEQVAREELPAAQEVHVLRTIAAHRAILARHQPDEPMHDWKDRQTCTECGGYTIKAGWGDRGYNRRWPCPTLLSVAAIYQDRDGFDPSWKVET